MLESVMAPVMVYDVPTGKTSANKAALDLLGGRESDDNDRLILDTVFLKDDGAVMQPEEHPVNLVLAAGKPVKDVLIGIRRLDLKQPVWTFINANPLFGDDGEVNQVISAFSDISDQKAALERLAREAEVNAAMAGLAETIIGASSGDQVANLTLDYAKKLTRSEEGAAGYIDREGGFLVGAASNPSAWPGQWRGDGSNAHPDFNGLCDWVLKNRQAVMSNDVENDPRFGGIAWGGVPDKALFGHARYYRGGGLRDYCLVRAPG